MMKRNRLSGLVSVLNVASHTGLLLLFIRFCIFLFISGHFSQAASSLPLLLHPHLSLFPVTSPLSSTPSLPSTRLSLSTLGWVSCSLSLSGSSRPPDGLVLILASPSLSPALSLSHTYTCIRVTR